MPRRILFYTHAFSGGGAETVFARLAAAFAEAGDDVIFAADYAGAMPTEDRSGLRHIVLGKDHAAATSRLAALLRRERPEASFSALGGQNLKHLAAATLAGRRARCVLGVHGFAAAEPRRLAQLSYRWSCWTTRRAARTICVSDALLEDMVLHWGASRDRLTRIYNPLPAPRKSSNRGLLRSQATPLVLAIGRLDPVKRFGDLVEAFALQERGDVRLAILGEGGERARLTETVARLGLGSRVTLPGHVADPSPWYARAACLAVSSASESFGLTVAEALAHGVPVVTTDCGGPPEVLDGLGRVVPVGDVPALAAALAAALDDPGDPAPRVIRSETFSLETIRQAYARLADALRASA